RFCGESAGGFPGRSLHLTGQQKQVIQGQAVEAACQPARTPLAGWRLPEGKRATLARRPLPFPSVMCLTQECFFLMLWNCS
ncbi:hypothetical protein, partial [Escherichia coli]